MQKFRKIHNLCLIQVIIILLNIITMAFLAEPAYDIVVGGAGQVQKFVTKNKNLVFIDKRAKIGENVIIYENLRIEGECVIGDNVTIFPGSFICNSIIGKGTKIYSSHIENSEIGSCCHVGAFAVIKNSKLSNFVKVGSGAAVKNSNIWCYAELSHGSVSVGAEVGERSKLCALAVIAGPCDRTAEKISVGSDCLLGASAVVDGAGSIDGGTKIDAGAAVHLG